MIEFIQRMHGKFGFHEVIENFTPEQHKAHLELRLRMIKEEVQELEDAIDEENPEEIVDALIDNLVFTLGTLDLFKVDSDLAYESVMEANIEKERGVKEGRPNPFGFPDLIKPEGWTSPTHEGNHGTFGEIYDK